MALNQAGIEHLIHYLDDFLFLVPPTTGGGADILALAQETFQSLGVPIWPNCVVVFLGILVDTLTGELRLPLEKLRRLQDEITEWTRKKSCTRRELERFLGYLCHAATVVRPGRTFLRRLLHCAKQPHHFIRLSPGAHADILWWKCLLHHCSGHSFFPPRSVGCHVYLDASGGWGCGALAESLGWFKVPWPSDWQAVDISVKELVPVAIAAAIWGPQWSGIHVCFHSDNMAVIT